MSLIKKSIFTIFLLIVSLNSLSQQQVKGSVIKENGKPIKNVHFYIKNSSTGTITNKDGFFNLNTKEGGLSDSIIISCLGYNNQPILLKKTQYNLDEVLIYPYSILEIFNKCIANFEKNYKSFRTRNEKLVRMNVIFSDHAKAQLREIYQYYKDLEKGNYGRKMLSTKTVE